MIIRAHNISHVVTSFLILLVLVPKLEIDFLVLSFHIILYQEKMFVKILSAFMLLSRVNYKNVFLMFEFGSICSQESCDITNTPS